MTIGLGALKVFWRLALRLPEPVAGRLAPLMARRGRDLRFAPGRVEGDQLTLAWDLLAERGGESAVSADRDLGGLGGAGQWRRRLAVDPV